MTVPQMPPCCYCIHLGTGIDWDYPVCKAFPEGIPEKIWLGDQKHKKPTKEQTNDLIYEGDNGYEPVGW